MFKSHLSTQASLPMSETCLPQAQTPGRTLAQDAGLSQEAVCFLSRGESAPLAVEVNFQRQFILQKSSDS